MFTPCLMSTMTLFKRFLQPLRTLHNSVGLPIFRWRRCPSTHCDRRDRERNMPKIEEATHVPWMAFLRTLTTRPTGDTVQNAFQQAADESTYELHKLRSWAFSVNQFGCLSINTPHSVIVAPINPHDHPAADRAFVHLLKVQVQGKTTILDKVGYANLDSTCHVHYEKDVVTVSGNAREKGRDTCNLGFEHVDSTKLLWLVEIPMLYDVDAMVTEDGSVTVEELENQTCTVQTCSGDIVTRKLKSDRLMLKSVSGNVNIMEMLQGNLTIEAEKLGNVTADRLQGQNVCVNTDSGAILIKDVYSRKSSFHSVRGDMNLGNLHGDVTVSCKDGNLKIGSLDGSLRADVEKGNISVYLAQHKDVEIVCNQGNISVMTSPDIQTRLDLQASGEIIIPEEFTRQFQPNSENQENKRAGAEAKGYLNGGGESSLTACTQKGNVTMSIQSWIDSLQLHK